jgi:hypothetical protein
MVNTQASTTESQTSEFGELCVGAGSCPVRIAQDDQKQLTITLTSKGLDPFRLAEEIQRTLQSQCVNIKNVASVVFDVTRMGDTTEIPIQFFVKNSKTTPVQVLVNASQYADCERMSILKLQKPNVFQITSVKEGRAP